jgi:hypothetical protein
LFGQLGDGTTARRKGPVQVTGLTGVIAIATNYQYSLAMKADGTVWTWGDGSAGTLPGVDLHVPQQVGLGVFDTNHNGIDDRWEWAYFGGLAQAPDADFDGDGISNYQEFLRGTDPRDYFNGVTPIIEVAGGNNQIGDPGTFLSKPFKVRVRKLSGEILVNAPVTYTISEGSGALAYTFNGPPQASLLVRTDNNGEAAAYHVLSDAPGASTRTIASAGLPNIAASTTFRAIVRFSLPPTPTPTPGPPDPNASPTPGPSATPIAPYRYAIIDLGKDRYPTRINNKGQILLQGVDANDNWGNFRWKGGVLERLNYAGPNSNVFVSDINNAGTVVGYFVNGGPWVPYAENDMAGGLVWPENSAYATKISTPSAFHRFEPSLPGSVRQVMLTAISNAGGMFGYALTGTVRGFLENTIPVFNSEFWPTTSGAPMQLSQATAINNPPDSDISNWQGDSDTITRANSSGQYIGRKSTPAATCYGFFQSTETAMFNGQSVSFDPVDINEADIAVASAGADMVVGTSPTQMVTISGASPIAINDHTRPAPSLGTQPSPSASPAPTPVPIPQILAFGGGGAVLWERQDDGHTWHPFGLEEMIPSMDGWDFIIPYDMNDNGAIVGIGWYHDPSNPQARSEEHAFLLVPVELMVDGNRDGEMSFDDPAVHDLDTTTEETPYRFWVNDDDDGAPGDPGEHVPPTAPDYADGVIRSARDLEDFARLHVNLHGLEKGLESGSLKAAFEWREVSGSPKVKLYRAASAGLDYLTKVSAASSSTLFPFKDTLGEVVPGVPLFIPQDFWVQSSMISNVPKTLPVAWFLFEGSGEGKGQLVVSFWKDGQKVGESPGVWLDLKSIKKLYQHQVLGGEDPWKGVEWQPLPDEQKEVIVFVHGWRLSPNDAANFAETMFKRLWWRGFKGRFAAVRWDTYYNSRDHGWIPYAGQSIDAYLSKYNDSEHNAWLTGTTLKAFVDSLPSDYTKNIVAHSMGNVVTGSALQQGMIVSNYALLNAALPASCYHENENLKQPPATVTAAGLPVHLWNEATPDDDPDPITRSLAYRGRLKNVAGNLISFYLPDDYATSFAWELNNALTKPPAVALAGRFLYRRDFPSGQKLIKGIIDPSTGKIVPDYYITDPNEAEAYACQTWGKAVGAEGRTAGPISQKVDLSSDAFSPGHTGGFSKEHSAQFNYDIQQLQLFYVELLSQLSVEQNP